MKLSTVASSSAEKPRLIIADDNIRDVGGHFFELANLLLGGCQQLGYEGVLATHASFDSNESIDSRFRVVPTFQTRRLVHWSMGVDGHSKFQRDLTGKSIGGSLCENVWTNICDRFRPRRRPQTMLRQWSEDLARLLVELKPGPSDSLLINTGDDFALLALAAAMQRCELPPMRIDMIFHFALYQASQPNRQQILRQIGAQIRAAVNDLKPHNVHLHATTKNLAKQLRETECGSHINAIPYPTRTCSVSAGSTGEPLKAVLAGLPRAEKGRASIVDLLSAIEATLLKKRRFQISMQMPAQRWQAMIPKSLHGCYQRALAGKSDGPLEVMTSNLSTTAYHDWLDTADVGLFLYDSDRYLARCSGVLLEMLARGIPVIVPDGCWLADQVRIAGGHRSIGFIYQQREEIPELMNQFIRHHDAIRARSIAHATTIAKRHCGSNTLRKMGLSDVGENRKVA